MEYIYAAARKVIETRERVVEAEFALQRAKLEKAAAEREYFARWGEDENISSPLVMISLDGKNWGIEVDPIDGTVISLLEIQGIYQEVHDE